jgi:type IV pilus assembly protein PilE
MRRSQHGFTLIEVMITVAIIAILSAIALPSYTQYVTRSRITEAVSGLSGMRIKMEQFFQDNRTYAGACNAGTIAALPTGTNFVFDCNPAPTLTTYTVRAIGKAGSPMAGFTYTLDQLNAQTTTSVPPGWSLGTGNCWVLKKDGSC